MACFESKREDNMHNKIIMKMVSDSCHLGDKIKVSWAFVKCLIFFPCTDCEGK